MCPKIKMLCGGGRFVIIFALFFALGIFTAPAFAQRPYDSSSRQVNTSEWLQTGKKKTPEAAAPETTIEEVTESQKNNGQTALPEQLPMTESPVIEGRGYADKIFSSAEIEDSHAANLTDFLQGQGLLTMQSGGAGAKSELSFKGLTSFCVKVYIDGVLANNPATGEFDWNSLDIYSVESIRISEIPEFGVAEFAGCSIFITTKSGKSSVLRTETAAASYEKNFFDGLFQSVNYSSNAKNFFYRIGATMLFADNEFSIPNAKRNLFNFSKQGNFNFSWNAKIPAFSTNSANDNFQDDKNGSQNASDSKKTVPAISLSGSNNFAYNALKVFGTGNSLAYGIEEDYTTQHNVALDLGFEKIKLKTTLAYFYGHVDYFEDRTPTKDSFQTTNSQSVELRQTMNWVFDATLAYKEEHLFSGSGDRHKIDFGASKTFAFKKDDEGRYKDGRFLITPCIQLITWGGNVVSQNSAESWKFKALPRLTINIFDLYISAYRLFTLPTFNQLYWKEDAWSSGNPNLKPENGWAATIGFKRQDFPLFARFTYSFYQNKITWGTSGTKYIPQNAGSADYFAGALGYEQEVWKNHLVLKADFSVTEARLRGTKKQIMWVPEFQAHATAAFRYEFFSATIDYSFTGKRYASNLNIERYPAFHLLDFSMEFRVNTEFTIYAKATNLLDQQVPYHDNYYIPSRKYTIGLRFEK